jgi:hypothetical protein
VLSQKGFQEQLIAGKLLQTVLKMYEKWSTSRLSETVSMQLSETLFMSGLEAFGETNRN